MAILTGMRVRQGVENKPSLRFDFEEAEPTYIELTLYKSTRKDVIKQLYEVIDLLTAQETST